FSPGAGGNAGQAGTAEAPAGSSPKKAAPGTNGTSVEVFIQPPGKGGRVTLGTDSQFHPAGLDGDPSTIHVVAQDGGDGVAASGGSAAKAPGNGGTIALNPTYGYDTASMPNPLKFPDVFLTG